MNTPDDPHRSKQPYKLVLIDPGPWDGHSSSYTARLVDLLRIGGSHVTLFASATHETSANEHISISPEFSYADEADYFAHADAVVDLDYARTLQATRLWSRCNVPTNHVLHGVAQMRLIDPRERWRPRSWLRIAHFVASCKRDLRLGHRIIVHTPTAQRYLRRLGIESTYSPLPVLLNRTHQSKRTGEHFLFLGGMSDQKGFRLGLEALTCEARPTSRIVVTGCSQPGQETIGDFKIQYLSRVSEAELWRLYDRSTLVILPYSREYERTGAASLVLQEALYCGSRIVAGPWAAEQSSSKAVTISPTYTRSGFAEAISTALEQRDQPQPSVIDPASYLRWLSRRDSSTCLSP